MSMLRNLQKQYILSLLSVTQQKLKHADFRVII
jgi:hypothetical protein